MLPLQLLSISFVLYFVYQFTGQYLRKKLKALLTATDDLLLLGQPRNEGTRLNGTAIIAGGSLAGLLSARVCADHFEKVVIIEPETWVCTTDGLVDRHRDRSALNVQKRARIPQYSTIHEYQVFNIMALRRMFSTFDEEVRKLGGDLVPSDMPISWSGIPMKSPRPLYLDGKLPDSMTLSRPLYETLLRKLLLSHHANVQMVPGSIVGLSCKDPSINAISSVAIRSPGGEITSMEAGLIVDCTGPPSAGFKWLQDLSTTLGTDFGLDNLKTTYHSKASNCCYEFYVPDELWKSLENVGFPKTFSESAFFYACFSDPIMDKKGTGLSRKENNILQISAGGWSIDEGDFKTLEDLQNFYSTWKLHQPLPDWIFPTLALLKQENVPFFVQYHRYAPLNYIQYHLATDRLPSNFVAVGDALMTLNPTRGQGCTKACVEAVTLNAVLHQSKLASVLPGDFARRYFSSQFKRTGILWGVGKAEDYAWKTTIPTKGDDLDRTGALTRAYSSRVLRLALEDASITSLLFEINHFIAPPTDLLTPPVIVKVLIRAIKDVLGVGSI